MIDLQRKQQDILNMNNLKILYTSAEVYPYAGVGGLGQVSYFLTKQLKKEGIDARIFMPKYGNIDELKYPMEMLYEGLTIHSEKGKDIICNIYFSPIFIWNTKVF